MSGIGLSEVIEELRRELQTASAAGAGEELQFEMTALNVEFQIGVARQTEGKAGLKFYVVELGGGGSVNSSETQKITISFTPARADGRSVRIAKGSDESPLAEPK